MSEPRLIAPYRLVTPSEPILRIRLHTLAVERKMLRLARNLSTCARQGFSWCYKTHLFLYGLKTVYPRIKKNIFFRMEIKKSHFFLEFKKKIWLFDRNLMIFFFQNFDDSISKVFFNQTQKFFFPLFFFKFLSPKLLTLPLTPLESLCIELRETFENFGLDPLLVPRISLICTLTAV